MNLTLRLSTKLISLQNMTSMEIGQSSESSDRISIFIKGVGFQIEIQRWDQDFNFLLSWLLFWNGNATGQIEDVQSFYKRTILSPASQAHFDSLKSE